MNSKTSIKNAVKEFKALVAKVSAKYEQENGSRPSNEDLANILGVPVATFVSFLKESKAIYMKEKMAKAASNFEAYLKGEVQDEPEELLLIDEDETVDANIDKAQQSFADELSGTSMTENIPEGTATEPAYDILPAEPGVPMTAEDKYLHAMDELSAQCDNKSNAATAIRDGFLYIFYPKSDSCENFMRKKFSILDMTNPVETIVYEDDVKTFSFPYELTFEGTFETLALSEDAAVKLCEQQIEEITAMLSEKYGVTLKINRIIR